MTANKDSGQESKGEAHPAHNREKKTIGEELFLIYLKRRSPEDVEEEQEEERPTKRRATASIGEELYLIHLKRSRQGAHQDESSKNSQDEHELCEEEI